MVLHFPRSVGPRASVTRQCRRGPFYFTRIVIEDLFRESGTATIITATREFLKRLLRRIWKIYAVEFDRINRRFQPRKPKAINHRFRAITLTRAFGVASPPAQGFMGLSGNARLATSILPSVAEGMEHDKRINHADTTLVTAKPFSPRFTIAAPRSRRQSREQLST